MTQFSDKIPPPFDRNVDIYSKWKKSFIIWQSITDVANTKQGGLLVLRLDEDTREEVLELVTTDDLKTEGGVKKVTDQLDKIFQKDETATAYEAYEDFETYQRSANTSITEYCREFQRRLKKVEDGGTKLADHILAYRLIKSAHLGESQGQLLKATTTAMTYAEVTNQLKKIFKSDNKEVYKNDASPTIKDEPVETHYGGPYRRFDRNNSSQSRNDYKGRVDQQGGYRPESNRWSKDQPESNKWSKDQGGTVNKKGYKKRGKNALDQYGRVTRCLNCDSINHWIRDCPDLSKQEQKTYLEQCDKDADDDEEKDSQEGPVFVIDHAALLTDEFKDPTKVTLSCNTMSSAVLDCGAPKNVCGRVWLQQYIETLSDSDRKKIVYGKSKNVFKFGCGNTFPACQQVDIPATIGEKKVIIQTDVVEGDIPLLFSKESMKKTEASLNFTEDTLQILGQTLNLEVTESGHYALPLGAGRQMLTDASRGTDVKVTFLMKNLSPEQTAVKLHRQFAHPSAERLVKLVESQGKDCEELVSAIREVTNKCRVCLMYKKPSPRTVVGFPMATRFGECVAMDLEQSSANKNENTDITAGQRKTRGVTFEDSVEDGHTELSVNNAHEPPQPEAIDGLNSVVIEIPADEETEVRVVVDASATEDNTAEQLVRENEVLSDDNAAVEEVRIATEIDIHQAQGEVEELTDGDEVDQENSSSETSGSSSDDNNIDHDGIGTVSVKLSPGRPRKNKKKSSDDGDSDRKALLRTGVKIRFKAGDNEAWTSATLGRRAGKKSGENTVVNFDKDVVELLHDTANREVTETYLTQSYINKASEETQIAKQKELDLPRNNEVYTEVENTGQEYVTGKWVIKPIIWPHGEGSGKVIKYNCT